MLNLTNGGGANAGLRLWLLAPMVIAIAVVSACTTPSMVHPQPEKGFVSISAGVSSTCGVHADGWASCWPHNGWGKIDIAALDGSTDDARVASGLPGGAAGGVRSISMGDYYWCGLKFDESVTCSDVKPEIPNNPPADLFRSVSAGSGRACGVKKSGTVACWGRDIGIGGAGLGSRKAWTPPKGEFLMVDVGPNHGCGVRADRTLACWGADDEGQSTPPTGPFQTVSPGWAHTCGVRADGRIACWGSNQLRFYSVYSGQATPPTGTFRSVSAGWGTYVRRQNGRECSLLGRRRPSKLRLRPRLRVTSGWDDSLLGRRRPGSVHTPRGRFPCGRGWRRTYVRHTC